jgi:hypothetical protein
MKQILMRKADIARDGEVRSGSKCDFAIVPLWMQSGRCEAGRPLMGRSTTKRTALFGLLLR